MTTNDRYRGTTAVTVVCFLAVGSAAGQLTNLTAETTCVPGGRQIEGTLIVAPCRPTIACCNQFPGCRFVDVSLSASNPQLATVPDEITVDRNIGSASFSIQTSPPLICIPTPCPSAAVTITASDGTPPDAQEAITIWRPSAFIDDFELDPPTVLGGTISLGSVTLQCAAPPGGWSVQVTTSDSALADPVVDALTVPAGEQTASVEIATAPVTHLSQATITITGGGGSHNAVLTLLPGSLDLIVRKMEVTQGIQYVDDAVYEDNSVLLVRNTPTAVRVYLESNTPIPVHNVSVSLVSRPCGSIPWTEHPAMWPYATVAPVDPDNPQDSYRAQRQTPDPGDTGQPLNATFLVDPTHLETGCLDFEAQVNPAGLIVEEDYTNNTFTDAGHFFVSTQNLNVKFVQIDWCPGCPFDDTPRYKPSWNSIYSMISLLEQTYPVDDVRYWKARKEVNITSLTPNNFENEVPWGYVLVQLAAMKALTTDEAPGTFYYGLLDERVPHENCGMGWVPPAPRVAMGVAAGGCGPETTIHEIGHNAGRLHAPCAPPGVSIEDVDPDWPEATNPDAAIGQTGFDVVRGLALPGAPGTGTVYRDFMSYCAPEWVSPYTYMALHNALTAAAATLDAPTSGGEQVDHILVRGVMDENGEVSLSTSYHQDLPAGTHDAEGTGLFAIVLRDSSGDALFTRRFTPELTDAAGSRAFFEIMPYPPGTAKVDVIAPGMGGDEVLETADVSANAPQVTLTAPNGGEAFGLDGVVRVSWTASDPDDDPLSFAVLYSHDDGLTWEALAVDVPNLTVEMQLSELAGTSEGRFRVVATDGLTTGMDDSDSTFSVGSKAPDVTILSPPDRSRVLQGSPVLLRGTGTDPEDGPLSDDALVWSCSRDGLLGGGATRVEVLSQGVHRIRLRGEDSDLDAASRFISVVVGLVGDCDEDGTVELSDVTLGINCLNGPGGSGLKPDCACVDVDGDDDVDLFDSCFLQELFRSGTTR